MRILNDVLQGSAEGMGVLLTHLGVRTIVGDANVHEEVAAGAGVGGRPAEENRDRSERELPAPHLLHVVVRISIDQLVQRIDPRRGGLLADDKLEGGG